MTGKTLFRSTSGCCICGTKSSSSRFTPSSRFSQHFEGCFGKLANQRIGDLCNACVLCVKRWTNQPWNRRGLYRFAAVLDSKHGVGPKHMKQIMKQKKRRDNKKSIEFNNDAIKCDGATGGSCFIGGSLGGGGNPVGGSDAQLIKSENKISSNSSTSMAMNIADNELEIIGSNLSTNGGQQLGNNCTLIGSATFRTPEPPVQTIPSRNRYRRQCHLTPVKIPNNEQEVDQLLREIMAQNSQAVNFDCREMHMAVQNRLRLRSRTVSTNIVVVSSHANLLTTSGSTTSSSTSTTSSSTTTSFCGLSNFSQATSSSSSSSSFNNTNYNNNLKYADEQQSVGSGSFSGSSNSGADLFKF